MPSSSASEFTRVDPLARRSATLGGAAQAMLDQGAPDALALAAVLYQDQRRAGANVVIRDLQDLDVADLMRRCAERGTRA